MQGSFSYSTDVYPPFAPPQQIDMDDGMFLPVSYVSLNEEVTPSVASIRLFNIVEAAILPLCKRKGWKCVEKNSCVRIILSKVSHLDIALYAVPDKEFSSLVETAMAKRANDNQPEFILDSDNELYRAIPKDQIMLAEREQGWIKSDPRLLEEWFLEKVKQHGEVLRRVCRYIKSWRDQTSDCEKLASIALMSIAVDVFDGNYGKTEMTDDDLCLLNVAKILPAKLQNRIKNPVVDGAFLDQGWNDEQRNIFVGSAHLFSSGLERSINYHKSKSDILTELQSAFGTRVPNDESKIDLSHENLETKSEELKMPFVLPSTVALEKAITEESAKGYKTKPYFNLYNE